MTTPTMSQPQPPLPFLSKSTFATAISHLTRHIDAYSPHLKYEVKYSPFDKEDVYLEITTFITAVEQRAVAVAGDEEEIFEAGLEMEAEEYDPEALIQPPSPQPKPPTHKAIYTITLSPIYSVPILHFTITPVPPFPQIPITSLQQIYNTPRAYLKKEGNPRFGSSRGD
ncbi:hypothetical protein TWF281_008955 [Arthrobotrys megalospora]